MKEEEAAEGGVWRREQEEVCAGVREGRRVRVRACEEAPRPKRPNA